MVWTDTERSPNWEKQLRGKFSVSWNYCWTRVELTLCRKKSVPTPTPSKSSILPLLKDVVHTPDIQHYLIKLSIEYTDTLNSHQVTAVDFSDQPIYVLCKIIQSKYPEFACPKYFALFGALSIETELLIANGHLVAGAGLHKILGDISIDTAGLKTLDVNHNHKATYSVQVLVLSIYTCLREAHKASNSALLLFWWAEERSSSSLFMHSMLIMKFQINYLLFIRFMREDNFKSFVKTLIFLVKRFFIFDHYNYNFAVQISRR